MSLMFPSGDNVSLLSNGIVFMNVGVVHNFGLLLADSNYAVGIFHIIANRDNFIDVDEALTVVNICAADALAAAERPSPGRSGMLDSSIYFQ